MNTLRLLALLMLVTTGCLLPVSEVRPADAGPATGGGVQTGGGAQTGGGQTGGGGPASDSGVEAGDGGPLSATVSVIELGCANAGNGGQGLEVHLDFSEQTPVREDGPGPWGCKAWVSSGPRPVSADVGPVRLVSRAAPTLFPPQCAFVPSAGYLCVVAEGTGGVVNAGLGPLPLSEGERGRVEASASLSVSGTPFGPRDRGRHLRLAGSALGNDSLGLTVWDSAAYVVTKGVFPISPGTSPSSVVQYATPRNFGADEVLPADARWWLVMGAGPNPFVINPILGPAPLLQALLADTDQLSVSFDGSARFPAFSVTDLDPADNFYLTFSTTDLFRVPFDGRPYTLACRDDYEGCEADTAALLELETTDGVPPADELAFPPVVRTAARVRCLVPATRSATVPADYLALLGAAGPTRLKVTFAKVRVAEPNARTVVLVGHGLRGISTP